MSSLACGTSTMGSPDCSQLVSFAQCDENGNEQANLRQLLGHHSRCLLRRQILMISQGELVQIEQALWQSGHKDWALASAGVCGVRSSHLEQQSTWEYDCCQPLQKVLQTNAVCPGVVP